MSAGVLYLHGFRSSPLSIKSRLMADAMAARGLGANFHCPALSHVPQEAIAQAKAIIVAANAAGESLTLVGSSLGGYYATYLAETFDLRAALINPAVIAPLSLYEYIGTQTNFHSGERFEFTAAHIAQLKAMDVPMITPSKYLLLVEQGDEVLDYQIAVARYAACAQRVFSGGDHSFTRFAEILPQLFEFCRL